MIRKIPIAVLASVAAIGVAVTIFVDWTGKNAAQAQFDLIANEAADRLESRVQQNLQLLNVISAYLTVNSSALARTSFAGFTEALNFETNYVGVFGFGFALITDKDHEGDASRIIFKNYGVDHKVWPDTTFPIRTAVVLREPYDKPSEKVLGYDMYSEPVRREAMSRALQTGETSASGPVELLQDAGKNSSPGFIAYFPAEIPTLAGLYDRKSEFQGLVFASFRVSDLHDIVFKRADFPAAFQTVDMDAPEKILAQSREFSTFNASSTFKSEHVINVGGRQWLLRLVATDKFVGSNWRLATMLLGAVSLLLAAALATSTRAQFVAVETAQKLAELSRKSQLDAEQAVQDKDLMLQEMKHRIRNSITRVLAIARQTASGSKDLPEFSKSYFARLQSMAAAQELLTRSRWDKADIAAMLEAELKQVLGDDFEQDRVSGETVMLNERAAQALGLTFHELATNALKYGDPTGIREGLTVNWFKQGGGDSEFLVIVWMEPSGSSLEMDDPKRTAPGGGFGSRLITMSVERELGGTITREAGPEGLVIRLRLPWKSVS